MNSSPRINVTVSPEGSLEQLSHREVKRLRESSENGLHELLRRCSRVKGTTPSGDRAGDFPVDIVYTWVNQSDPAWIKKRKQALTGNGDPQDPYLCLDGIREREFEARLHHIPGLAEHFLYLNDDFFLGRPLTAADFFQDNEISRFFPSPRKIDTAPVSASDLAVSSAAKRGQALLKKRFGKTVSNHILHAPYPLRRSVLFEMENVFPGEFTATVAHSFRHQQDHSIAAFLYFHYARFTGRAIPAKIRHMYLDNRLHQFVRKVLLTLLTGRHQAFCINGGYTAPENNGIKLKLLRTFLKLCFPKKCEFEVT